MHLCVKSLYKKQRKEIVVLLGYKDGLKSLKKKNITKDQLPY